MIAHSSIRPNKSTTGSAAVGKGLTITLFLTGFTQETGFRVFNFDKTTSDRAKTQYSVKVDLAKAREYGIQMQELPLLCRGLLEQDGESIVPGTLVFTEEKMCLHARLRTEARQVAMLKRKPARRPVVSPASNGFRSLPQGSNQQGLIQQVAVQQGSFPRDGGFGRGVVPVKTQEP